MNAITRWGGAVGLGIALLGGAILSARGAEATNEPPATPGFYLLIGQSNMAGRGKYEKGDAFPRDRVFILDDHDRFIPLQPYPFVNQYSTIRKAAAQMSPGYMFAITLLEHDPATDVYLLSNARGGTSIQEWKKGTRYFHEAVRRSREAMKQARLAGILWHQGETDYREIIKHRGEEAKYLEAYMADLRQFIQDLRSELGNPAVPFVAGQLNSNCAPFNERLLKLPAEVPHTAVVTSEGLTTVDGTHFDRASVFELGRRYARALIGLRSPAPTP